MYHDLKVDGVSLKGYKVYINGTEAYNSAERDVELIEIPGRNGAFALDKNRFKNITVQYNSGTFAENQSEFAQNISVLRNFLASRKGYVRIEDDYNPDEYRMGLFTKGLEFDPVCYNMASEFPIEFNMKPQRFLKSGEEKRDLSEWGEVESKTGYVLHFDGALKNVKKFEFNLDVMQEGYRDPSLTNVRNFVPHDYGYFYKARKNLLRPTATSFPYESNGITYTKDDDGVITANGTATENSYCQLGYRFPVYQNLMMTGCPKGGSASTYSLHLSDRGRAIYDTGEGAMLTPNPYKNIVPENIYISIRSGVTVNDLEFRPMVRLMDTSSDYEPFSGYLYDANFNQDVYGGRYDYVSGVLTITHKLLNVTFAGRSSTAQSGKYGFYTPVISGIKKPLNEEVPDAYCNRAVFVSRYDNYRNTEGVAIHQSEGRLYFYFNETSGMTLADAQSWLESNPIQVVYPLETPETVQLTARALNTFEGITNLYARSGSIDMEYGDKPGTVNNPTLFPSKPMLEVKGYGTININDQPITIDNTVVGNTQLIQPFSGGATKYADYGNGLINTGDTITVAQGGKATYTVKFKDSIDLIGVIIGDLTGKPFTVTQTTNYSSRTVVFEAVFNKVNYTAGTNGSVSANFTANIQFSEDGLDQSVNLTFAPGIDYTANNRRISIYAGGGSNLPTIVQSVSREVRCQQVTAYSTVSTLGDPTYIDLEIGEAYKMVNGEAVSLNNSVSIGSVLPTLAVGENPVTYPNTITSLEIVPRWWRV